MRKPALDMDQTMAAIYEHFCSMFGRDIENGANVMGRGCLKWEDAKFRTFLVDQPTQMASVTQLSLLVDQRVRAIALRLAKEHPHWHVQMRMRDGAASIHCLLGVHVNKHDDTHLQFGAVRASILFKHKDFRYKRSGNYVQPIDHQGYSSFGYQAITAIRFNSVSDKLAWRTAKILISD